MKALAATQKNRWNEKKKLDDDDNNTSFVILLSDTRAHLHHCNDHLYITTLRLEETMKPASSSEEKKKKKKKSGKKKKSEAMTTSKTEDDHDFSKPEEEVEPTKESSEQENNKQADDDDDDDDDHQVDGIVTQTSFASLGVCEALVEACDHLGWKSATRIQEKVLPDALAGRDIIGLAETGSGKTGE